MDAHHLLPVSGPDSFQEVDGISMANETEAGTVDIKCAHAQTPSYDECTCHCMQGISKISARLTKHLPNGFAMSCSNMHF